MNVSHEVDDNLYRYAAFLLTYLPRLAVTAYTLDHANSGSRYQPLMAALQYADRKPGIALEFGVFKGASINHTANRYPSRKFYGFDSFEGFPNDGRNDWDQDFSVQGRLPNVPSNATLIKGYFSDTLDEFLSKVDEDIVVVNIDCDIYSSTKCVFDSLIRYKKVNAGLVLAFDELINYSDYIWNEMYALFELLEATNLGVRWISCHSKVRLIEETMILHDGNLHPTWTEDLASGYRQQASLVLTEEPIDYHILTLPHISSRIAAVANFLKSFKPEQLGRLR